MGGKNLVLTSQFPVPQDSVEQGLLASVDQNVERWLAVTAFHPDEWTSCRQIFQFMVQYQQEYGTLPSNSQIGTRHQWNPPIGDFAYWLKEMKRYSLARKILESLVSAQKEIGEPERALNGLLETLSIIRSRESNHISAYDSSGAERLERFDYRTQVVFRANALIGIPSGFDVIDSTHIGYIPGSLVGCYARPGVGKTWWLLWSGINCWLNGGTVLAITPEMPSNFLDMRVDVLAGRALGLPIEYNKLLIGDPIIRPNYEQVTQILSQSQRWWTYDSFNDQPIGLSEIWALIRQHNPDIVLVDGVSLLRPANRNQQVWEQVKTSMGELKHIATIKELAILVTNQAVNSARGRRTEAATVGRGDDFIMPSLNDSAYSDSFVQFCSDIITMCGEPTSDKITWYSLRKYRERGWGTPLPPRMALVTDFGTGLIRDLSHLGYDPERVGQEMRQILGSG